MTPQNQEYVHNPEQGIFGDCFRATLASLLDKPISEVPHFLYDNNGDAFQGRLHRFLNDLGYIWIDFSSWDLAQWKINCSVNVPIYHAISDISPRFPDSLHCVVGCDGKVFFDPHPSKAGLPEITHDRTFGFIIPVGTLFAGVLK